MKFTARVVALLLLSISSPLTFAQSNQPTYDIATAFQKMVRVGQRVSMTVGGDCNGNLTIQSTPTSESAVVLDGRPTLSSTVSTVLTLADCHEDSKLALGLIASVPKVYYFDSNHLPFGKERVGKDFGFFVPASGLSTRVKVGDSGVIGSMNFYGNNRKNGSPIRREDLSFAVESVGNGNVIFNIITKFYDTFLFPSSVLEATEQSRFLMDPAGTVNLRSIDMQYVFPPRHIVSVTQ